MFNGVPEQFHQFIDSRISLPLHLSPPTFSTHDLQPSHQVFQSHHLEQLHHHSSTHEDEGNEEDMVVGGNLEFQRMRSVSEMMDPWLKEEVLALLTTRSGMGSGFSDFIWEHVSRKLEELGFKRSPEKCKEKFEEVSKYCNNYGNTYGSFSELEALFKVQNHSLDEKMERNNEVEKIGLNCEENSGNETLENPIVDNRYEVKKTKRKKRERYHKFKLLKYFVEVVNKIMVQQEEIHMKLLEDMMRREEKRVAREEAWRQKKMDRLNKEIEIRAQEQAMACQREATIIEFMNKLTSSRPSENQGLAVENVEVKTPNDPYPPTSSPSTNLAQNAKHLCRVTTNDSPNLPISSTIVQPLIQTPSSLASTQNNTNGTTSSSPLIAPKNPNFIHNDAEDQGKRWPKEEVYSLINLRCNLYSNGEDKESTKTPLWERISQGMLELGYKRSAKKCKEKWENINKYFRKTKDANKKRSLDSKTCPYFHQLSSLYNQGRLMLPPEEPENHLGTPEACLGSCQGGFSEAIELVVEVEKNVVQASPLVFEY